jgi:dynein heavy chain
MCKLYILCSEQLSQQPHYDYGLRAVKSVLVMAGGLKRANPTLQEDLVLIRALRDSNQPKFLADDIPLFQAIILDLFPGVEIPPNDYGEFMVSMQEELTLAHLQHVPGIMNKIIQVQAWHTSGEVAFKHKILRMCLLKTSLFYLLLYPFYCDI